MNHNFFGSFFEQSPECAGRLMPHQEKRALWVREVPLFVK